MEGNSVPYTLVSEKVYFDSQQVNVIIEVNASSFAATVMLLSTVLCHNSDQLSQFSRFWNKILSIVPGWLMLRIFILFKIPNYLTETNCFQSIYQCQKVFQGYSIFKSALGGTWTFWGATYHHNSILLTPPTCAF